MKRWEIDVEDLHARMDEKHRERVRRLWGEHSDDKWVVSKFFGEEMSAAEIAAALQVPVSTIKGVLYRAKLLIPDE